jgi:acyl-CoA dehydrogenase
VLSAIAKYHMTERARQCVNDGMDIVGGKGICLGPNNWIGRGYQLSPVAITVEGANILTRTLIIFGQGAIRCHPYVLREMRAAKEMQGAEASREFDDAFTSHASHVLRNGIRAFVYGIAPSLAPTARSASPNTKHYYRHVSRLSAAFAFLADISMIAMGGALKRKEKISGRLGDVLSMMYLVSATLKRYEDQGRIQADLPLVRWSVRDALHRAQEAMEGILSNFPVKSLATLLRWTIFPAGKRLRPPLDSRNRECARIALEAGAARERLTAGMYHPRGEDATAVLEAAFQAAIACEPIDKKLREAQKQGLENPQSVLSSEELVQWQRKEALRKQVIKVDDFPQDFGRAALVLGEQTKIAAKAA